MANESNKPYPAYRKRNRFVKGIGVVVALACGSLLAGLGYCGLNFLYHQKNYPTDLSENRKIISYRKLVARTVEGKGKTAVLHFFRAHGARTQVSSDGSIDCFPGKAATGTDRFYIENVHTAPLPNGQYWSFTYSYGGYSLFGL